MKKNLLALSVISLLLATSCQKKQTQAPQAAPVSASNPKSTSANRSSITVESDILAFNNFATYKDVVNVSGDDARSAWITESNSYTFHSLLNNRASNVALFNAVDDNFFRAVINVNGLVKIDKFYVKINAADQSGYVLLPAGSIATSSELTSLINQDISQTNIIGISETLDIITALEECSADYASGAFSGNFKDWYGSWYNNPSNPNVASRCKESAIGSKANLVNFNIGSSNFQALAAYNNYGIYHSLFGTITPSLGGNQFKFEFSNLTTGHGHVHYKIKCGSTTDYDIVSAGSNQGASQRYQSYQGSTGLNEVYFKFSILTSAGAFVAGGPIVRANW